MNEKEQAIQGLMGLAITSPEFFNRLTSGQEDLLHGFGFTQDQEKVVQQEVVKHSFGSVRKFAAGLDQLISLDKQAIKPTFKRPFPLRGFSI